MEIYYTHYNGENPFKVEREENKITVYDKSGKIIFKKRIKKIFVGKSTLNKLTEKTNSIGSRYDGNSILLWINNMNYIFIGAEIYSFKSDIIIDFFSQVGFNDIPYPYAIDLKNRYYLFTEKVILEKVPDYFKKDPYEYYFNNTNLFKENIESFVGTYKTPLFYTPEPNLTYNMLLNSSNDKDLGIYIIFNNKKYPINKSTYINLNKKFGNKYRFHKIKSLKIIYEKPYTVIKNIE